MSTTYVWWQKGDQLGIGVNAGNSSPNVAPTGLAVRYFGVKLATDFTDDMQQESELATTYHRALLAGLMRDYAEDDENFKAALFWSGIYNELRREAKREANNRKDGTPISVAAQGW